ncbi:MAG: hypothetical protein CFE24_14350 [Flavobacterium sp. BFFFF2]|nr:MAG: hypothetical protein CFE24_14350 [Flavobacterium sp. BFFFF2]
MEPFYYSNWTGLCFANCASTDEANDPQITLNGPPSAVGFTHWEWQQTQQTYNDHYGDDSAVVPLPLTESGLYQLALHNEFCDYTSAGFDYNTRRCDNCEMKFFITDKKYHAGDFESYQLFATVINLSSVTTNYSFSGATFVVIPSSLSLEPGEVLENYSFTIIPILGFDPNQPGAIHIEGSYMADDILQYCNRNENIPPLPSSPIAHKQQSTAAMPQVTLFPNPGAEGFDLNYAQLPANSQLKVFDLMGRQLSVNDLSETNGQYHLSAAAWPSGTYIVVVIAEGQIAYQHRWIKQ